MKSIKQLIIIAVAFVVFLGTLGMESVFAGPVSMKMGGHISLVVPAGQSADVTRDNGTKSVSGESREDLKAGDVVEVKSGTDVSIVFSDRGLVRLSQNDLLSVDFADTQQNAYVLNLKHGRAWLNTIYTSARLNVVANGAYLIPDNAAVDVNIDGQKTIVYANRHQVNIGLVPLNYVAKAAVLFPTDDFINSYLLSEGNQTTVFADKITQNETTLRKLFYSKLVKEFPFGIIDPQLLNSDAWLKNNIKSDTAYEAKIQDDSSQQIRSRGLKVADVNNTFGQALNRLYNFLTLSQSKVFDRTNDEIFDHFDDAKYLLMFGQTTKAKERLDIFTRSLDESLAALGDAYKLAVLDRLRQEYDSLAYVTPDDSLAQAKSTLVNYLLGQLDSTENDIHEKFLLVRGTMDSVYDLADKSSQSARRTLEDYFTRFNLVVNQEKSRLSQMRNILAEENQVMDNLLRYYPIFYRDRFFAMKNQLEQQWLSLLPDGEDKNEEKQTIISTKIDFLRQLQAFFLADKIAADDAKQIVFRLFREADDLQLPADQQVAVNDLYAKRLQDFGVFFRYLNTPEYVATTLHGSSRKAQFDDFVQAQQEQVSIDEVRREILGNQTAPVVTTDMILAQAQKDFGSINAQEVIFGALVDVNQKVVPLNSAVVSGVNIRGQYNWDSKLLSQIYAGDILVSADPVNLGNLAQLVQTKTQQPVQVPETQQQGPVSQPVEQPAQTPVPVVSKTERVAKILLMQKLKAADIAVTEADLTIVDLGTSQFGVAKAILVSDQSVSFSFDVDGKNNIVTNLVVTTAAGPVPVDGTLNLADVSARVKEAVAASKPA